MPQRRTPIVRLSGTLLVCCALSCKESIDAPVTPETVSSATLDRSTVTIAVREQAALTPAYKDTAGRTLLGVTGATWASSDPSIVSVDQTGLVQGVKFGGPISVTVSKGGVRATAMVTVVPIVVGPQAQMLGIDSVRTLEARANDYFGVTIVTAIPAWTTSNASVVRIDAGGRVIGVSAGLAVVTATYAGILLSVPVEVGIPTVNDGTWVGDFSGTPATVLVAFGEMRAFDMPFSTSNGCVAPYSFHERLPIVNNQFSMNLPYESTATGTFTGSAALLLAFSQINLSAQSFAPCPGLISAGARAARTITLHR